MRHWGVPRAVRLAPGEEAIWRGGPDWRPIAARVFHARVVAAYFLALTAADLTGAWLRGMTADAGLQAAVPGMLTGMATLLILTVLAWATARTTRYTVTTRRVVMQFGIGLPATLTLPLPRIAEASVRIHADHAGDIALRLYPGERVGIVKLWPHARPWRVANAQPMLRCVPQAAMVAAPLCRALAEARRAAVSLPSHSAAGRAEIGVFEQQAAAD